ncbi:CBS domain-containing protein [Siccirubricoccus phaeus]|uniref:CBS domain-containing protein n=1 Tax=Siccirubricoccus phaeus TaxID=2595053 RepID=UPI001F35587F|nr:CBS domain-containing protein [Siccirubricoccus phaeus]
MAEVKQNEPQGAAEAVRNRGRGGVAEQAAGAVQAAGQGAAQEAEQAVQRGSAGLRESTEVGAEALRRTAEAGRLGGAAVADGAGRALNTAAAGQRSAMHHVASEMQQAGSGLAAMAEEAAQGLRHLMAVPDGRGLQDSRRAMQQIMEGVVASHLRLTQELMRRSGPGAMVELQHRFVRDYFGALAEGGAVLLRAARQMAEDSLAPLEREVQRRRRKDCVRDVMTTEVKTVTPEDSVQQAAKLMSTEDTGALPVREGDRLVGMVTDRDLALRLVAEGRDPARTKVREVMSPELRYVFEDESLEHVAENMAEQQIRRLPVMNREKRLVGILSLGDLAAHRGPAARALEGVSAP